MPPILATFLTLLFVFGLFRYDKKWGGVSSKALWIPFWWLTITCSREISTWCSIFGIPLPGGSLEEGNPVNRLVYLTLIVLGFNVLRQRSVSLGEIASRNVWLAIFLAYCLLAVTWADFPFVSLKRWIKVVGQPIMALIILTEADPRDALIRVLKRCSFILLPVSILFIKYYPELGRGFGVWSGQPFNQGITDGKNMLGVNCLLLGFTLAWHWMRTWNMPPSLERKRELWLCALLISMNAWLTSMADSKTPLVALLLGLALLIFTGFKWVRLQWITGYITLAIVGCILIEFMFDAYATILHLLGRDATLTERTDLWPVLIKEDINQVFGVGFESFWIGKRLDRLWDTLGWECNSAHNGYLETYLNLGLLGLFLLIAVILATYSRACRDLMYNPDWGRLRYGLLLAFLLYNWTEAGFRTMHPMFFMFYIIAIDISPRAQAISDRDDSPA